MPKNMSIDLLERAILGTMLKENYLILDANIKPGMFQSVLHRSIYKQMLELATKQKPVDYLTLLVKGNPEDLGGANYLADFQMAANSEKFDAYLELFLDAWRKRKMKEILYNAQAEGWSLEKVQKSLDSLESNRLKSEPSMKYNLVDFYELAYQREEQLDVVPTVIENLEKLIDGFRNGEVTIIAARPSMGKTDVMNHFALHAGWAGYLPIIFSLEMSKKMLIRRLIASTGKINRNKMRDPYRYLSDTQREEWPKILNRVNESSILIDDSPGMSVNHIRAQARQLIKNNPSRKPIIFIDYLQIIYCESQGNQTNMIGEISWAIKQMAKEFDCPIVCLSQLNRGVEGRQNKRPVLSDLRDSGNIEQDADVVILLYRDNYYLQLKEQVEVGQTKQSLIERLELNVAKNRNGGTGVVYAAYNKATGEIVGAHYGNNRNKATNN